MYGIGDLKAKVVNTWPALPVLLRAERRSSTARPRHSKWSLCRLSEHRPAPQGQIGHRSDTVEVPNGKINNWRDFWQVTPRLRSENTKKLGYFPPPLGQPSKRKPALFFRTAVFFSGRGLLSDTGRTQKKAKVLSLAISLILWRARRGFELLTPKFVVWCSIQLSYGRLAHRAGDVPGRPRAGGTRAYL